jgi:hypothetical protein
MIGLNLDARNFEVGMDAWLKEFGATADQGVRAVASRLFENIVRRTPVGDPDYWVNPAPPGYVGGYARNNWWFSLNETNANPVGRAAGLADTASADIAVGISRGRAGDVFYIQNGVDYILYLERGTGSPRQAPNGMVVLSIEEMVRFFQQYMTGVRR